MNPKEENVAYLSDQVFYTGFGANHKFKIAEMLDSGQPNFKIQHNDKVYDSDIAVTMNFEKSKKSERYFFNSYDVILHQNGKDALVQNFKVRPWEKVQIKDELGADKEIKVNSTLTLKEAINFMSGRWPLKDFVKKDKQTDQLVTYKSHVSIDLNNTDKDGNHLVLMRATFNYQDKLSEIPVKELENPDSKRTLLSSLERGNRQGINISIDGKDVRHFAEVDAMSKSIILYDSNMERLGVSKSKDQEVNNNLNAGKDSNQNKSEKLDEGQKKSSKSKSSRKKSGLSA